MKKVVLSSVAALAVFAAAAPVFAQEGVIKAGDKEIHQARKDLNVVTDGPNSKQVGQWVDDQSSVTWSEVEKADDLRLKANSLEKTIAANEDKKAEDKKAEAAAPAAKVLPKTSAVK